MEKRSQEKKNKEKLPVFIIAFAGTILLTCGVIYMFKDATSLGGDFNAIINTNMTHGDDKMVQCKVANCEKCSRDNYCSSCKNNYKVVNGKCVEVKNCYKYGSGSDIEHTYNADGVLKYSTWTSNGKECITNLGKMTKSECDKKGGIFNSAYKVCAVNAGKCICYH